MAKSIKNSESQKIILCIDDRPGDRVSGGGKLNKILTETFEGSGYKPVFANTWKMAQKSLKNYRQIGLVLLDYQLGFPVEGKVWQGPHVADWLYRNCPGLRFIGLTQLNDRGKKIEFGHCKNNVDYIVKKELAEERGRLYLLNIVRYMISDYGNRNWDVVWHPNRSYLEMSKGNCSAGINIPAKVVDGWCLNAVLTSALRSPRQWVGPFPSSVLSKAVNEIDKKIRKDSNGLIGNIFTTENSPSKCVMALADLDRVVIDYPSAPIKDSAALKADDWSPNYVTRLQELEKKFESLVQQVSVLETGGKSVVNDMKSELKNSVRMIKEALEIAGLIEPNPDEL